MTLNYFFVVIICMSLYEWSVWFVGSGLLWIGTIWGIDNLWYDYFNYGSVSASDIDYSTILNKYHKYKQLYIEQKATIKHLKNDLIILQDLYDQNITEYGKEKILELRRIIKTQQYEISDSKRFLREVTDLLSEYKDKVLELDKYRKEADLQIKLLNLEKLELYNKNIDLISQIQYLQDLNKVVNND